MPGLTLMIKSSRAASDNCDACKAQSLLLHSTDYRVNSVADGPSFHVGWVAYDEYPVRVVSNADSVIYLEGRIYNRSADSVEADLVTLAASALEPGNDRIVERFMVSNEGSYIIAI